MSDRDHPTVVSVRAIIYAIGGRKNCTVSAHCIQSNQWKKNALPPLHVAREWASSCFLNDFLYVFAGSQSQGFLD